jgi:hypothetical protein
VELAEVALDLGRKAMPVVGLAVGVQALQP